MESIAIVFSLLGTSAMLAYIAQQFKSSSEGGSKYASIMKIFFNAISFTVLLFVPISGLIIAESTSIGDLGALMTVSLVPVVFLYIVFVFYLLWEYLSDLIRVMSGNTSEFETEEFR